MKTQRQTILGLLQTNEWVNSYDLTYKFHIKQAPTRVHELKKLGYNIVTSPILKNGSVDYRLVGSQPKPEKPIESQPRRAEGHWDTSSGAARWIVPSTEQLRL